MPQVRTVFGTWRLQFRLDLGVYLTGCFEE